MSKRKSEPDEALGPVLDGLEEYQARIGELRTTPQETEPAGPEPENPDERGATPEKTVFLVENPVALVCGSGTGALATASLALACGFGVKLAIMADEPVPDLPGVDIVQVDADLDDFVEICGIDREYFVCVFFDDPEICEDILHQCLASEAFYLGLSADAAKREAVLAGLRAAGAPDAELAAISCPMGLAIGASEPEQTAVAIIAELLAARAGTLKRLRAGDQDAQRHGPLKPPALRRLARHHFPN